MDGICSAVMDKIKALGTCGRYFIISADEFLEEFPEGAERSEAQLKKALKNLSSEGYVDIKYSSGNMYCIAVIKNYVPEQSPPPLPAAEKAEPKEKAVNPNAAAFWAAFAGGAAGGIVTALICLLFLLC